MRMNNTLGKRYKLKDYNFTLIIFTVILSIIGIFVITSANAYYENRQIIGLVLGLCVMVVVSLIDYNYILNFYWVLYVVNIALLLMVKFFGDDAGGAVRWIDTPFIRFQPSELTKILMILFLAKFLVINKDKISTAKTLIITLVLIGIPVYMIEDQPDLSTSIVVFVICIVLLFIAEISYKIVCGVIAVAVPAVVIFFYLVLQPDQTILNNYQYLRIMSWLEPDQYVDTAYQQQNSIMAIGSGCLWGKGLFNDDINSVKNGNYISEPQTDFIFAVAGEELGFVGSCVIIILLLLITLQCIYIGAHAKDLQGKLICCGVGTLIGFQSFVNICVVTGLMPNTGLPLPFVSYGLTSLVSLFIGIGLVLNVGLQKSKF